MSEARTPDALDLLQSHKPQTEAGKEHLTAIGNTLSRYMDGTEFWATMNVILASVLAIEDASAAPAPPALDVERLRQIALAVAEAWDQRHVKPEWISDLGHEIAHLRLAAQEEGA